MHTKRRLRQTLISLMIFVVVILAVISVDPRVRERFEDLMYSGGGVTSVDDRASEVGSALVTAVRHRSIDNAPLMIFTVVGAVLFIFMFRT